VELDPQHAAFVRQRYADVPAIEIRQADFLMPTSDRFDYVIGNPPYVGLTQFSESEKTSYRAHFSAAKGRFDLYLLFFEQALNLLTPGGRLVFITPEKYLYVQTAAPLRKLLSDLCVEELQFMPEATFERLVTYPLVTTLSRTDISQGTRVITREGEIKRIYLRSGAASWLPSIRGEAITSSLYTVSDVCSRISCGVATGADSVFVMPEVGLDPSLRRFGYPTLAGREISPGKTSVPTHVMLLPYSQDGKLLLEGQLGALRDYLATPERRARLMARTCVRQKPWYAFHETPPMRHLLRPKILCKDIGVRPFFMVEEKGAVIPRHSAYYIVPNDESGIFDLADHLNSPASQEWLRAHCQRAANNFIRLQSHVLKRVPVPEELATRLGVSPLTITEMAA
jgi:hypothetical protein